MRFPILSAALAALCFALPATAQKMTSQSQTGTRAETRMAVMAEDFSKFAIVSLTHGQPEWKAEYDGMLDKLKGKLNRLGKDWFTTMVCSGPMEIGGSKIPAGYYIVGLHCDEKGQFALAFMDAGQATRHGITPFSPWKPEFTAPLTLNKGVAKEDVKLMTMTFAHDEKNPGAGTFTLAWGKHTLTAPVMLHTDAPKSEAGHEKKGDEHGKKPAGHQ